MRENRTMSESPSQAGKEIPTKKQKLSSDENSNPDLSGDENVSSPAVSVTPPEITRGGFLERLASLARAARKLALLASSFVERLPSNSWR